MSNCLDRSFRDITSIMTVSLRSFLLRKNFSLLLDAGVESNLLSLACCFRTVLKIQEYETMMMKHGSKNPTEKMNFFGDRPFFFKIVQEKVSGAYPSSPQSPMSGKN